MAGKKKRPPEEVLPPRREKPEARRKREPPSTFNTQTSNKHLAPVGDKTCGAKKRDGGECTQTAGWGTTHPGYGPCKFHYGSTPMGRKGAARDMADELMVFYGQPLDTNPIDALLDEIRRTAGHIDWLGKMIARMKSPDKDTRTEDGRVVPAVNTPISPEAEGVIKLYQSERAHLVRTAKAALDAGVNERLVQIAEHQGNKLADTVEVILARLNLTPAQLLLVPDVVPAALRQLTAGPTVLEGVLVEETDEH